LFVCLFVWGDNGFHLENQNPRSLSLALMKFCSRCFFFLCVYVVHDRPTDRQRYDRTVAVECCYQNVGIATSLALTMFQGDELHHAMGIPFFYGVCEGISVGIYCFLFWKAGWTKAPKDESLWKVLTTSYEIVSHETAQIDFTTKKEDSNNTNVGLPSIEKASEVDYVEMGNLSPLDTNNNNKKPIR